MVNDLMEAEAELSYACRTFASVHNPFYALKENQGADTKSIDCCLGALILLFEVGLSDRQRKHPA
jgi:hypothetical protein